MKIQQLPSGSYRVRKYIEGHTYSLTFDHKPTNREITKALAAKLGAHEEKLAEQGLMDSQALKYIDKLKSENKSPTTIGGYLSIFRNTPEWFLKTDISAVDNDCLQELVDEYKRTRSAKSTANLLGFYRAVLSEYRPSFVVRVKLPARQKSYEYEPSTKDIQAILEYSKDSRYYLFLRLAVLGLRRGEVACITAADLNEDNVLTINKDLIVDNNKYVVKPAPKTAASNRRILIPSDVADMIRTQGKVFEGNLHTVNEYLHKVQDALQIPRFRLHILRHFAAAFLLKNGFTTKQIEDYMGWEHGSSTMQKVYAYNLDPEESQKDIVDIFNKL